MPTISSAGIGSGLDVASIIEGLMAVESRPLQIIQAKRGLYTAQISAYGELTSSVSAFQTAADNLNSSSAFDLFKTSSSNTSVINIASTDNPDLGNFDIEVSRLAGFHKMSSDEILSTDTFGGIVGDSFTIQVGNDAADIVTVDLSTSLTLEGIRDAINDDENNPGVRATLINGDNDIQKLVLTAENTGEDSALSLSYAGTINAASFGLQTLNNIGGDTSLLNAEFIVDGFTVTRSSNTVSDVITGVTFDLLEADVGNTHTLSITRDDAAVEKLVKSFADAYSTLRSSIDSQRSGSLGTDNILLAVERQISNVLNKSATTGSLSVLWEIGLSIEKDGSMSVDSDILSAALDNDHDSVAQLFTAENDGFANRLSTLIDGWIGSDGLLSARTDGLNSRIDDLSDRQLTIERNLELVEARYRAQFTALDTLISQLQNTGQYLTAQLAQLPDLTLNRS